MEPMRLLVTDAAAQPPRQATAWLIMTLGRKMIDLDNTVKLWHVSAPMSVVDQFARMDAGELWHQKEAIKAHASKVTRQSAFADSDYSIHDILLKIITVIELKSGIFWRPYIWIMNLWGKVIFFIFGRKCVVHIHYGFLVRKVSDKNRPISKIEKTVNECSQYYRDNAGSRKIVKIVIAAAISTATGILITAFFWHNHPEWFPN